MNLKNKNVQKYLFVLSIMAFPMALFLLMYVYVNLNSFFMAFQKFNIDGSKVFVGFDNFRQYLAMLFEDSGILNISIKNSLKMYLINLVICMPLYILFAYMLFKRCRGHSVIRAVIMIPQVVSGMIIALLLKKFVDNALPEIAIQVFGAKTFPLLLTDSRYAFGTSLFYMIWVSFSISLIVYSNAMNEIDEEILASARVDGIDNMFLELWYIILPLIYPTLNTFLIVGFANFLNESGPIMTFYFASAPDYVYNTGYYYAVQLIKNNTTSYNMLAAGGLMMSFLIAPLTYLVKWLLEKFGPEAEV